MNLQILDFAWKEFTLSSLGWFFPRAESSPWPWLCQHPGTPSAYPECILAAGKPINFAQTPIQAGNIGNPHASLCPLSRTLDEIYRSASDNHLSAAYQRCITSPWWRGVHARSSTFHPSANPSGKLTTVWSIASRSSAIDKSESTSAVKFSVNALRL